MGSEEEGQGKTVPLSDYVGVKEMLRKAEEREESLKQKLSTSENKSEQLASRTQELETEVTSLGEKLKTSKETAVDPKELETANAKIAELTKEKRDARIGALVGKGAKEEDIKELSEEQLDIFEKGLGVNKGQDTEPNKPGADGGEGGSELPKGAHAKIKSAFDAIHPEG